MLKRFFVSLIIGLILIGGAAAYLLKQYRREQAASRQNQKAPDQQITIIEGWSNTDIANMLQQKNILPAAAFLDAERSFDASGYPVLADKPKTADLQGYLFPDTYRIPKTSSSTVLAEAIIKKSLDNFQQKFTQDMQQQAMARSMTVYQILTLASIIEKETGRQTTTDAQKQALDTERRTVAGIFYNRLRAGMPLESDATVNYATGKKLTQPSLADTQTNSPYNTYKNPGLPPGPICNPSLSSIQAALNPINSDYMYFLHRPDTGQAVYSATYQEHLANKQKYLGN